MIRKIEIFSAENMYTGYLRIDRYRLAHERFQGGMTPPLLREVMERGQAVGVLPYDPQRDEAILIEQFRIGAYLAGRSAWLTEIVAGVIGDGETPETVARRETLEETGLVVEDMLPVGYFLVSPGCSTEGIHVYCAKVDSRTAGGVHGLAEEGEDIRVNRVPFSEVEEIVRNGLVSNLPIAISLQWLILNRARLRDLWTA